MERTASLSLLEPALIEQGTTLTPRHSSDVISYSTATYRSENAQLHDVIPSQTNTAYIEGATTPVSIGERWRLSPSRRKLGGIAAAATAVLTTGVTVFDGAPAAADEAGVYTVVDTQIGVYARNSPHTNDTQGKDGLGAYDGDRIQEICGVTDGDPVGERNNHTWHKVKDLNRPDEGEFWISDHWLNTPNPRNQLTPGETNCNDSNTSSDQEQLTRIYNGERAAQWAKDHARDPQIYNSDERTWFASNALWNGGMLKTPTWTDNGSHGHLHNVPGTVTAWVTPQLKDYILSYYSDSTYNKLNLNQPNIPAAKPGDIIFYDWNGDGKLDHASVVIEDKQGTQDPEVSEWGNVSTPDAASDSQEHEWTFSQVYNDPIAQRYSNPQAFLLHIDTDLSGLQVLGDPNQYNIVG